MTVYQKKKSHYIAIGKSSICTLLNMFVQETILFLILAFFE